MTSEPLTPASGPGPVAGIDFTSRPTKRKPIVVALGRFDGQSVRLDAIQSHTCFDDFSAWLRSPGDWVGAFDLPFGLPRELIDTLGWPTEWLPLMRHYAALSRAQIRDTFAAFCNARPVGAKFAHRGRDGPAGSSPSMKWVNPPVAFMLHAGVPLLIDATVHLPGLQRGDMRRVAVEGYPGLLAREVLGSRSYKSGDVHATRHPPPRSASGISNHNCRLGSATRQGLSGFEFIHGLSVD